jgi:zinc/manganese transport system substrate-binding protein
MKSMTSLLLIGVAFLGLLAPAARAELKIVTTTPTFADFARQIGGDKISAYSVMKGPENIHNVLPTPAEMLKLNQADLFVHSGLDTEPWRDNLLKGARNPKVAPGKPGNVDMSTGLTLKDVPTRVDRAQGEIHAYGNPHFGVSPVAAQRMVATLAKAMMAADPANADLYKANAVALVKDIAATYDRLLAAVAPYKGLQVMTYHKAWLYFLEDFGFADAGQIEAKVGISPSGAELKAAIDRARAAGVKVVVVETYNSLRQAQTVAAALGATALVLPDEVNGLPEVDTFQKLMTYDVEKILAAAKAAGIQPAATRP